MLKLLIARHGNTFDKYDVIRRVGLRTDIPLSNSGINQCSKLGQYIFDNYKNIDHVFCSQLQRTQQTAEIIVEKYRTNTPKIKVLTQLNEIDYGIDEGKPESDVLKRLGEKALKDWDDFAIIPEGWLFDKDNCEKSLLELSNNLIEQYNNKTVLLITSNGIARFLPSILKDKTNFQKKHKLKMPTASISEFIYDNQNWQCKFWGSKHILDN